MVAFGDPATAIKSLDGFAVFVCAVKAHPAPAFATLQARIS
jgi:hypothetical protein